MRVLFSRLAGFGTLPLISAFTPLLLLPIVARVGGAEGWTAIAVAQSVGTFAAVATGFGWNLVGPPLIAATTSTRLRHRIYRISLATKRNSFVAIVLVALPLTAALVPVEHRIDAVLMCAAMAVFGFSPAWYCIGVGSPGMIARFETVPKLAATAAAIPAVLLSGSIWPYPVLLLAGTLFGLFTFNRFVLTEHVRFAVGSWRSGYLLYRRLASAAFADVGGAAYASTPVPLATGLSSTAASAQFASADKIYRYGLFVISASANAFQGWVLEPGARRRGRRQWIALAAHAVVGVTGLVILLFMGPFISALLFGEEVGGAREHFEGFAVSYLALALSTPLMRNILLPRRRTRWILGATIAGGLTGLPLMAYLGGTMGASGVGWGLALSECIVLGVTLVGALRAGRRGRQTTLVPAT